MEPEVSGGGEKPPVIVGRLLNSRVKTALPTLLLDLFPLM